MAVIAWWCAGAALSAGAAEVAGVMPGNELVPFPKLASTRAVTIGAPPEVWGWLVQIGQGCCGFYSFDALENLLKCDIHSAGQILRELQELLAGDMVLLAPAPGAPCYRVAMVEPPRVLVLAGVDPQTRAVQPVPASPDELASTWQWTLRPAGGGRGTRLAARQRYSYPRRQSVLWHLVEPVDFVMEHRKLGGIKSRSEHVEVRYGQD